MAGKVGVRLNPRHSEMVRQKIRASQLVHALQNHALGRERNEMKATQIDAAKFLLTRILAPAPEQKDVNLTGGFAISWPLPKNSLDQ